MFLKIDHHSGIPVYRQIMDHIKFQIASGAMESGVELPSTRSLSSELKVNPMTISKAYSQLKAEGVLESHHGRKLTVKATGDKELILKKNEQLEKALSVSADIVRQLGVEEDEAVEIFRKLLKESKTK